MYLFLIIKLKKNDSLHEDPLFYNSLTVDMQGATLLQDGTYFFGITINSCQSWELSIL